jgi:hypothetical protein
MSEWLSRHRAIVWIAAVFLGPTIAGLLTLALVRSYTRIT